MNLKEITTEELKEELLTREDYTLYSTEELTQELLTRGDAGIVALIRVPTATSNDREIFIRWTGDNFLAIAMLEELKFNILTNLKRIEPDSDFKGNNNDD